MDNPGIFCSLVIPCYNEEGNIEALLEGFAAPGPALPGGFELILVENGSTDGTRALLSSLAPRYPFLKVVAVAQNLGYGRGICEGLKAARGAYVGWAHGDLQYAPREILAAAAALPFPAEKVFLKGLRRGRPPGDYALTAGMAFLESWLFGCRLWDINAQPTLFHRSLLENWSAAPDDFLIDLFSYAKAQKSGFRLLRFPVALRDRHSGRSAWNSGFAAKLRLALQYLGGSFRLRLSL